MIDLDKPYFVAEGEVAEFPLLGEGDLSRDRGQEYKQLFDAKAENSYAPVLCLTVFTADENGLDEVLVAVRDPDANEIHPNVISTPTMRISPKHFVKVAASPSTRLVAQTDAKHIFGIDEKDWMLGLDVMSDREPTLFQRLVDSVLNEKLGAWDLTRGEYDKYTYQAAVHSVSLGDSRAGVTEDWRDITEKIAMLNVLVRVWNGKQSLLPASTEHYSDIRWVKPDEYREMQDNKNLLPVFEVNSALLCIHGVCIATSRGALDDVQKFVGNLTA